MNGLNRVMLIGRVYRKNRISYLQDGTAKSTFTVMTADRWVTKEGEERERREFHRVVAWRRLGERCEEILADGRLVYVEGRLNTRSWEDDSGQRRYITEVVAMKVQRLSRPPEEAKATPSEPVAEVEQKVEPEQSKDDIPF